MMESMFRIVFLAATGALLLAQAQDLPDGKGKDLVLQLCQDCHDTGVIAAQRATKEGWQSIVDSMVERGAGGTKDQLAAIVDYLAKNFPPEPEKSDPKQVHSTARYRDIRLCLGQASASSPARA